MTSFRLIKCLRTQPGQGQAERIAIEWEGVTYTINQNVLNRFKTAEELKAALEQFVGQPVPDVFFHLNRDGSWAIATGAEPNPWPEDQPAEVDP